MSDSGNDALASNNTVEKGEASTPWLLREVDQYGDIPKRSRKSASWLLWGGMPTLFVGYLLRTRNFVATYAALNVLLKNSAPDHWGYRWLYTILAYQGIFIALMIIYNFFLGLELSQYNIVAVFISMFDWPVSVWARIEFLFAAATITFQEIVAFAVSGIGVLLLFWRTKSLDKQVRLNEGGLEADRFRDGCKLLTEEHYSARHAGIVTLSELARSNPRHYSVRVIDVLADYLRRPDAEGDSEVALEPIARPDMHQAFLELTELWSSSRIRNRYCKVRKALNLSRVTLCSGDFAKLCLQNVSFYEAYFVWCSFDDVDFRKASLTGAQFDNCSFSNPNFQRAQMQGVRFYNCGIQGAKWNGAFVKELKFLTKNRKSKYLMGIYTNEYEPPKVIDPPTAVVRESDLISAWVVGYPDTEHLVVENGVNGRSVLVAEQRGVLTKFRNQTLNEKVTTLFAE